MRSEQFETMELPADFDILAPDGSEIRVLAQVSGGSMAHGSLHPGCVSRAVEHRSVEEIWYVLSGVAEIWRSNDVSEAVVLANAGMSITIPVGTRFQFRTMGEEPFRFIMCTLPPWPGEGEAMRVPEHWPTF